MYAFMWGAWSVPGTKLPDLRSSEGFIPHGLHQIIHLSICQILVGIEIIGKSMSPLRAMYPCHIPLNSCGSNIFSVLDFIWFLKVMHIGVLIRL